MPTTSNPQITNAGDGPDVPPVSTPDQRSLGKSAAQGSIDAGWAPNFWKAFFSAFEQGLEIIISTIAGSFDFLLSLIVPFLTASQGQNTKGFFDLVAQLLNDLLGVDVAGDDLAQAQNDRGRIGAMQKVGGDLFNALANEFIGNQPDAGAGSGPGGLPGAAGTPLTPTQGVDAAKAFIGFLLSFSVRQGNVAVLTDALSVHLLGQIREYGEMMAKNLGLSRMARRALQPFIQTLIAHPLQQALNQQYRPHEMDARQIAAAYIRGELDRADYAARLALQGYTDGDINLLISDTYTRLGIHDVLTLSEFGLISDSDSQSRLTALGFNSSDVPLLRQARDASAALSVQREYVKGAIADLHAGVIDTATFEGDLGATAFGPIEKQWYKTLAENRITAKRKKLSYGLLRKMYLDATITLDELLAGLKDLGYQPGDVDTLEVEILSEQAAAKAKAAAKKAKTPTGTGGTGSGTPPTGA